MSFRLGALACAVAVMMGCTAGSSYDPDWDGEELASSGKADGLLDAATRLSFDGDPVAGSVQGDEIDLFAMELESLDRIRVVIRVSEGDLNPHLSLYRGAHTYVHSESWNLDGQTLTKEYLLEGRGTHAFAVRPYQNQGRGAYTIEVSCLAGPCNGEFPEPEPEEFGLEDHVACVEQARQCAFDALPNYNGAVGATRARQIFERCLGEVSFLGQSCSSACAADAFDGEVAGFCETVIRELPFFADASPQCMETFDACWSDCTELGGDGFGDYAYAYPSVNCFEGIWNGDCVGYAKGHENCGGTEYAADSLAECQVYCRSTEGAWLDDLDVICEEGCHDVCHAHAEECYESCDQDEACALSCGSEREPGCDELFGWSPWFP